LKTKVWPDRPTGGGECLAGAEGLISVGVSAAAASTTAGTKASIATYTNACLFMASPPGKEARSARGAVKPDRDQRMSDDRRRTPRRKPASASVQRIKLPRAISQPGPRDDAPMPALDAVSGVRSFSSC
jgi:hypothetical protein